MPADADKPAPGTAIQGAWVADRSWDAAAEEQFSSWIAQLGSGSARRPGIRLDQCLADPTINTLHDPALDKMSLFADCADLPMVLRAYFACRTRRPFQFVSAIAGSRYTAGNRPSGYRDFTQYSDFKALLRALVNSVHTGFYRTAPDVEGTDTYAVEVSRAAVRAGTVYYDPNGHVLVVYRVEDDGLVRLIDGHPDNSLTHGVFGEKYARGSSGQGGGFRSWWPYRVDGAPPKLRFARPPRASLPAFSATAQYQKSYDLGGGHSGGYHAWVRARLAKAGVKPDPVVQFTQKLEAVCAEARDRVASVDKAVRAGIARQPHPASLPLNIYGTSGDWETYATPSRDARLKVSLRELRNLAADAAASVRAGDGRYGFGGDAQALGAALGAAWNRVAASPAGRITWTDTAGGAHVIGPGELVRRAFLLSFDPYHGPELRWGARPSQGGAAADPEFATARDDADKQSWYWKEQRLRNNLERVVGAPTPLDLGPATPPDVDVAAVIRSLGGTIGA